jgi:hypothetical protein
MRTVMSPTAIGSFGLALSGTGSLYAPTATACGAGAPQVEQKRAPAGIGLWQLGQFMRTGVRRGYVAIMERESIEEHGRHDQDRSRVENLGADDEEFSSVEDVGDAPAENPAIDDV